MAFLVALVAALAPASLSAEPPRPKPEEKAPVMGLPPLPETVTVQAGEYLNLGTEWRLTGYVDIQAGESSIQADEMTYFVEARRVEAVGSVVLAFPGATLAGSRLVYDLETETGVVEDAVGYLDRDNALVRAKSIEKIDETHLRVTSADFTTCSQPTPYWSFRVSRATLEIGQYAHLRNAAFKIGKVPIFYTPYLVWPIKTDRATGLLFPAFGSSSTLGRTISIPFFWAFADNADVTLFFDWHSEVGPGLGAELNWLPTWRGRAKGTGNFIRDTGRDETRYIGEWSQSQPFGNTWKLRARLETVSDFDYLTDYVVDLARATNPRLTSWVDLTRQWSWYSFTARANRQKQYLPGLYRNERVLLGATINETLPDVEFRSASHRIGRSRVFLAFEGSLSSIGRKILRSPEEDPFGTRDEESLVTASSVRYQRIDAFPQLQLPLLKVPWGDLTVNAGWRGTYYTAQQLPRTEWANTAIPEFTGESVTRSLWNAGIGFIGPRFQRVYETPSWEFSPKLKHVVEPYVRYDWRPDSGLDASRIIPFDEVDVVPGQLSLLTYGIRTRFFALRGPDTGRTFGLASTEGISLADLEEQAEREARRAAAEAAETGIAETVEVSQDLTPTEIGSLQIQQSYSLDQPLTSVYARYIDPGGQNPVVGSRHYSPISITGRFNPTYQQSVDLTYVFDPANDKLTETSLSAMMAFRGSYFRGSWFRRFPANLTLAESDFLRTQVGVARITRGLSLEAAWDYNLATSRMDHYLYQLRWTSQCCSIQLGYDVRDFVGSQRRNISLLVNLSGIGKLLDVDQSIDR